MIRSNICVFVQFHESYVTIFLKIIIVHRENSFWTVTIGKGVFISNWFPIYFLGSSFSPGDLLPVEKQTLTAVETEDTFLVEDSTVEVSLARSTKSKTTGKPISWKRNFSSIKNREIEFTETPRLTRITGPGKNRVRWNRALRGYCCVVSGLKRLQNRVPKRNQS